MTFKRLIDYFTVVFVTAIIAGCLAQDDNSTQSGLVVHLAEVHVETAPASAAAAGVSERTVIAAASVDPAGETAAKAAAGGGYDRANLEHHDINDGAGHRLSLYRAYVVIDELELIPCTSLAQRLFNSLISTAQAHAGHGSEPVGGRGLDKPNVIDIVTQDEYYLALGDLAVAPGRYCGARVSLARVAGAAYGQPEPIAASSDEPTTQPEVPDLGGKMFAMRADYCAIDDGAGNCLYRTKVDIDDTGLAVPLTRTLTFDAPIEVNATVRHAFVALGIAYGEWMRGIDVSLLAYDTNERQKLLDNIAASLHIYDKGLGGLPANVAL